jgi:hypothetical protein
MIMMARADHVVCGSVECTESGLSMIVDLWWETEMEVKHCLEYF